MLAPSIFASQTDMLSSLNMRAVFDSYRGLGEFIDAMDTEAVARGEGPLDSSIDVHFRSGVYVGNGLANLVLSFFPGKLQTLMGVFGYKGDRHVGLDLLYKAGGWTKESHEPAVSRGNLSFDTSCETYLIVFLQRRRVSIGLYVICSS